MHSRNIAVNSFLRGDDGLVDIEASIGDVKHQSFRLFSGVVLKAGEPQHRMRLRVSIDGDLVIREVAAEMTAVPSPDSCHEIKTAYEKLVGLKIGPGFRTKVIEHVGGVNGCTHITDLIWSITTVAFQSVAMIRDTLRDPDRPPFQLNSCHTWDARGEAIRNHFPRWHKRAEP